MVSGWRATSRSMTRDAAFEEFWETFPAGRKRDKLDTRDLFVATSSPASTRSGAPLPRPSSPR
jgi:hypothetical protein